VAIARILGVEEGIHVEPDDLVRIGVGRRRVGAQGRNEGGTEMPARVVERTHVGASLLRRGHVPGIESRDGLTSDARGIDRRVRRLLREEEESGEKCGHCSANARVATAWEAE